MISMSLEDEVKRYSFYSDMCNMYESRLKYYKKNMGKMTEFSTKITKKLIENYEKSYVSFKERYKHLKPKN